MKNIVESKSRVIDTEIRGSVIDDCSSDNSYKFIKIYT